MEQTNLRHEHGEFTHLFRPHSGRGERRAFGIPDDGRFAHMYVVRKTGTGKSSLLEFLVRQDLAKGDGVALFDPHG